MKLKKNKHLYIFFLLILVICILTPISGDDYGNYISTNGKLLEAISIAKSYYYSLEGRFIGRVLIMFTTYHKFLWNIITSILFTLLYSSLSKFMKQKTSFFILLISLLLVNCDMFAQGYTWLAGSITYLYPTSLIIYYFSYIYFKEDNYNIIDYILLTFLSIIIPMFVENLACSFVLGLLILNIYSYIKNKKITPLYLINFLLSSVFLIIMLKSPGSASRTLTENVTFNNYNLLQKVIYNIPNFNLYVFFKNPMMIILTLIPIEYYLFKKGKKLFGILISIIPILSLTTSIYYMLPMKFSFLQNISIINTSNKIYILYWLIYLVALIYTINYLIKNQKLKSFIYFMLMLSFSSTISMLIVPTWGDRITLFNVLTLSFIGVILIDNINNYSNKTKKIINIITFLVCLYIITIFICIFKINNYRNNYIKEELNKNETNIKITRNPITYIWNTNPDSEYFIKTYKSYMNIPEESTIEIDKIPYQEYINIILGGN